MTKVCEYCHKKYTASKVTQKFCSGKCRTAACRERQQSGQKKEIKVYKSRTLSKPRRIYDGVIGETDPRHQLTTLRSHGLLTPEYWTLYQEVDRKYHGGKGVVNGIPTSAPNFVEAVLIQIEIDGRIDCWTQAKESK